MKTSLFRSAKTSLLRGTSKIIFATRKHSPEILIATGIVGSVAAIITACKATTKLNDILEERQAEIDAVEEWKAKAESNGQADLYTEEDSGKDKLIINVQTGIKVAKLYAPAVVIEVASLAAILSSHQIMRKRNLALGATCAAIDKAYRDYRERVKDRFGEDVEKQLRYNIHQETVKKKVTGEDGKEKTVTETVNVVDEPVDDNCIRYLTKSNPNWDDDEEMIYWTLKQAQDIANDKLRHNPSGILTLNEVYDVLKFQQTKKGMISGWLRDGDGDGYVEFDVTKVKIPNELGKYETAYAIDFNIDGDIYSKLA